MKNVYWKIVWVYTPMWHYYSFLIVQSSNLSLGLGMFGWVWAVFWNKPGGGKNHVFLWWKSLHKGELSSWQLGTFYCKPSRTMAAWKVLDVPWFCLALGWWQEDKCYIVSANRRAVLHVYWSFKLEIHESCGAVIQTNWERRDEVGTGGILHCLWVLQPDTGIFLLCEEVGPACLREAEAAVLTWPS